MKSIRRLRLGEDVTALVAQWFQQPREVFAKRIHLLLLQLDAGLNAYGNYFNGLYSSQNNPQTGSIWTNLALQLLHDIFGERVLLNRYTPDVREVIPMTSTLVGSEVL
jgi:hypothetical protein